MFLCGNEDLWSEELTTAKGIIHLFCVSKIFRKTNNSYLLVRTPTCAYQGVRNVSFSENFDTH